MRKNLLLCISAFTIILIVLEICVRIFHLAPGAAAISLDGYIFSDNPKLKYIHRPNSVLEEGTKINRDGYRGKSVSAKKLSNNAKRVLCIGDSVTLGIGLDNEETFSYQLERRLNQAKLFQGKWDVLNFGVNGYNTINEIEFLKTKGTHYAPDYVILQYCFNDNSNMSHLNVPEFMEKLSENYRLLYYLVNPFTKTLARSHLFLFCATRLKSLKISREDTYKWWVTSEYFYEGNIVEEGFKEFSQMADKNKFEALVLIVPRFENQTRFSDYTENYEPIVALM